MNRNLTVAMAAALVMSGGAQAQDVNIGRSSITLKSDLMTPEALWAMGRIGAAQASPDGRRIVYQVGYYSVKENKGHQVLRIMDADGRNDRLLTTPAANESDAAWLDNNTLAFLTGGQLWTMKADGTDRRQLTRSDIDIEGFRFSPDRRRVVLIKSIPYYGTIRQNPSDLPKATGMVITDMNYRHWDHYVTANAHPFVADVTAGGIGDGVDVLEGEPYESPLAPFGGIEQIDWSRDSKSVAYTCRKKEGTQYAISTDADIYIYNVETRRTKNLCKPEGYVEPKIDATKSMRNQAVNHQPGDMNVGYDVNPKFSPDGRYIAWQSMKNNGYESDRNRLCVYELATGRKTYVTESFDSNVDEYTWGADSKVLYFIGVWHATENIYQTSLKGEVKQLTEGDHNYVSIALLGDRKLLAIRQSLSQANEIFAVTPAKKEKTSLQTQLSFENKHIYDQLALGEVHDRWVKTTDGKEMQEWVVTPPHFDPNRKYPTLLFCEGGPQSPVSQFWSYRWNLQIMAANGYVAAHGTRR